MITINKRFAILAIALSLTAVSALLVYAEEEGAEDDSQQVDIDYDGAVDIYTGAPVNGNTDEDSGAQVVKLPDGGSFDRSSHKYVYSAGDDRMNVYSSVANGMVVTDPVTVKPDEGLSVNLFKNGKIVKDADLSSISDEGSYSVVVRGEDSESQILSFRIIPDLTGDIDSYSLPKGFYVVSVMIDDKAINVGSTGSVDMSQEGKYRIVYRCQATGIDTELKVTLDHTAPKIKLEGVKKGVARGPVSIKGVEKGDTLVLKRDGTEVSFVIDNTVRNTGKYEATVTDKAGNVTTKKFVIKMYLNYQSIIFFLVVVAIIGAAIGYMVYSNKKLKVR